MTSQIVTFLLSIYGMIGPSASTNRGLLNLVDNAVMTVNIPEENNWQIGMTLDSLFKTGGASPFTDASVADFEKEWNQLEAEGDSTFRMAADVMTSQDEKIDFLEVEGSLSMTYMLFSGDAHLQFLKDNVQCSSDVTVMVRATSSGRKKQMSLSGTNILKLKDSSILTLDEFLLQHGAYLIVGFMYGGEILFEATHSAKTAEDKMAIEGGLALSFGGAGFSSMKPPGLTIGGTGQVDYDKSDISKSINKVQEYSIRPSIWNDATEDLIRALEDLSTGESADDDSLFEKLSLSANQLLAGDDLAKLQAVVIPLSSVSAVHDKYVDNPDMEDTAAFFFFLNAMTLELKALSKQLELVQKQRFDAKNFRQQAWPQAQARAAWMEWDHKFTLLESEMSTLNTIQEIISKSKEYYNILPDKDPNADVLTADSFIDITALGMRWQFESAIMDPYSAMLAATTSNPTMDPTASPTTSEPTSTFMPTAPPTTSAGSHWIAAGDAIESSWDSLAIPNVECMANANRHSTEQPQKGRAIAVTCCAEDELGEVSGVSEFDGKCFRTKTYYEANTICNQNGYRLCTLSEMLEGKTKGSDCGHDRRYNWVKDECDRDDESAHYVYQGKTTHPEWGSEPDYYCQSDSNNQAAYYSSYFDLDIAASCCSDNDLSDLRYIFPAFNMDWYNARDYCKNTYGTSLATIRNNADWNTLKAVSGSSTGPYWIGLRDSGIEGQWGWQSDYKCSGGNCKNLKWWAPNEPNDHNNAEDCGSYVRSNLNINDRWCSVSMRFICDAPTMTEPDGHRPDCGAHPKTYEEAEQFCYSRGQRLCTKKEMEMDITVGKGCSYDAAYTWVSDPCSIDVAQSSAAAHVGIAPFDGNGPGDAVYNAVYVLSARDLVIIVLIATSLVSMITLIVVCQRRSTRSAKYKVVGIESDSEMEQFERE